MKTSVRQALRLLSLSTALLLGGYVTHAQEVAHQHAAHAAEAEEHSGRLVLGGSLSAWIERGDKTNLTLAPEVGYLFNEDFGIGLVGGYHYLREADERMHAWSLRPFARYYYMHREPFNLYLDGGFGVSGGAGRRGWEVGVRPGACVDLTKGICLCLRMGFVGYRSSFTGGEEPELSPSGWGFRFSPEELQIGLELEL